MSSRIHLADRTVEISPAGISESERRSSDISRRDTAGGYPVCYDQQNGHAGALRVSTVEIVTEQTTFRLAMKDADTFVRSLEPEP